MASFMSVCVTFGPPLNHPMTEKAEKKHIKIYITQDMHIRPYVNLLRSQNTTQKKNKNSTMIDFCVRGYYCC